MSEECNESNFKDWKVWDYSLAACKNRLYKHLTESGYHTRNSIDGGNRTELIKEKVANADYEQKLWKPNEGGGKKRKHVSAETPVDNGAVNSTAASAYRYPEPAAPPCTSSSPQCSRWRNEGLEWRDAKGALPAPQDITTTPASTRRRVIVTTDQVKAMADCLHRAGNSSTQLARLLTGAAKCCKDEREMIEEAKEALEMRIHLAGFKFEPPP